MSKTIIHHKNGKLLSYHTLTAATTADEAEKTRAEFVKLNSGVEATIVDTSDLQPLMREAAGETSLIQVASDGTMSLDTDGQARQQKERMKADVKREADAAANISDYRSRRALTLALKKIAKLEAAIKAGNSKADVALTSDEETRLNAYRERLDAAYETEGTKLRQIDNPASPK